MTTDRNELPGDKALDAFFAAARNNAPYPDETFLARIDVDALEVDRARRALTAAGSRPERRGFLDVLGGWPALAGLVTAAAAGLWIGYTDPWLSSFIAAGGSDDEDLSALLPGYLATDDWSS